MSEENDPDEHSVTSEEMPVVEPKVENSDAQILVIQANEDQSAVKGLDAQALMSGDNNGTMVTTEPQVTMETVDASTLAIQQTPLTVIPANHSLEGVEQGHVILAANQANSSEGNFSFMDFFLCFYCLRK